MAKLTLTDIASGYQLTTTTNANNTLIEAAVENTLSRDGTSPNTMEANLDLNSNRVVNLADGVNNQDAATVAQVNTALGGSTTAATVSVADSGAYWAGTTVEGVLAEIGANSYLTAETNDLSAAVTWANVPDANVTESSVTQHQAALSVTESQVSDLGTYLPSSGGTLTDYGITSTSPSSSAGSITLDLENSNAFQTTLTENITTVTISNPPANGTYGEFIWKVVQDSTTRTITFPAAVKWPGGTAPTISTGSGDIDVLSFKTWDGGTTWYGDYSQNYS